MAWAKRFSLFFVILLMTNVLYPSVMHAALDITSNSDGTITFNTTSTQATTGIKYRTVGFTVTLDSRCDSDNCNPRSGGAYGTISGT
ncbi:hypothetical protein D3C75_595000 [compost metagenome]